MRLTKVQRAELERHQAALAADRKIIAHLFEKLQADIGRITVDINTAIVEHNGRLKSARAFVEGVAADLRDTVDGKSEMWQESETGRAATDMAEEWENAALEDLEPVLLLEPDAPLFNESLNLPEETE